MAYWHKGEKAKAVFALVWAYLNVIEQLAGYRAYDPQLDCILDLGTDLQRASERYTQVVEPVVVLSSIRSEPHRHHSMARHSFLSVALNSPQGRGAIVGAHAAVPDGS